ncbi:outer membrane protein W [Ereboglobus sp. PH5-5]|uniref:outer membrane beta-barrel protein n=1 Tax=Ereboglobus sp. PH5-5 TaxID=2940529 RepID=UPI0024069E33|nr:outer membrane beta-barrel protein [Ereboglobus sp. PH5-5]MDF9831912.1 outer membrane protein W [Ereboglobus sp. PH5-5]
MKKQIALSILAIAFAGSAFAQLSGDVSTRPVSFYVEPSVFWVPSNNGLDDGFGGAISSGAIFHKHHQVGLDFAYFEADYDKGPGKMKFMPLTTSYQYLIPFGKCFQARAGVHAGAMFEKSKDQPGIRNKSRTAFTGGASLGLDWVINKNVSVGVGGKWLYVDETNDLRERNMALVGLNCAVKF